VATEGNIVEQNIAEQNFADTTDSVLSVNDIGISIDAGTIKSRYLGENGKTIVHIQDAHCNYEAQSNINKILDQLTKECGISMISVEGAEGLVDTAWFRAFPDAEIRKEVATYFMKKGEITGAEYFSINSDYNGTIFGAETRDYYVKNLKAFTQVYPYKDMIEKYFINTRTVANRLKAIVYPPKLRVLDSKIRAFENKDLELSDYIEYLHKKTLAGGIDLGDCENFKKLLQTLEYERKIDFDIVDQERSTYIDDLSKKLSKKEMTELVTQSIRFKKGHIKAVDFYTYLRDLAKEHAIPMVQEYPNLFYYYIYTKLYEGINNEGLFREIGLVERRLKKQLFTDETQEKLDKYSVMLDMFIDLVNIELTNEDYELFKEYSEEFSIDDVVSFMEMLSSRYNLNYVLDGVSIQINEQLPNMINFYEIAIKRDNALIANTLKQMEKRGTNRCVLIAGGFHTKGIKNILERKGISYAVVTPKITKDVETPYIKVLTNQRTSLEDIITESAAMPGVGAAALREKATRVEEELLAPLPDVFYTIPLLINNPKDLELLSEAIGEVKGKTTLETAKGSYRAKVSALIRKWLIDVKEKADPDVWKKAAADKLLLGAFLKAYQETVKEGVASQFEAWLPARGVKLKDVDLGKRPEGKRDWQIFISIYRKHGNAFEKYVKQEKNESMLLFLKAFKSGSTKDVLSIMGTISEEFKGIFQDVVANVEKDSSSENEDRRGHEHRLNGYYTVSIRNALKDGFFRAAYFRGKVPIETQIISSETREAFEQKLAKLEPNQLKNLREAAESAKVVDRLEAEGTKIIFRKGQKAHYSLSRNQIYLDLDFLSDDKKEELKWDLYHEVNERAGVIEGLRRLNPDWIDEVTKTVKAPPESRSPELKEAIIRLAEETHNRLMAQENRLKAQEGLGAGHELLMTALPIAQEIYDRKVSPADAVRKVTLHITDEMRDLVMPLTRILSSRRAAGKVLYGVRDEVLANALRLMQLAVFAKEPMIETDPVLIRYEWAGPANRIKYGLPEPKKGENDVAEMWFNSSVEKDGAEHNPSLIPGTSIQVGAVKIPGIKLRELFQAAPEILGEGRTNKPFFEKFLSTRFPPKAHMGFNEKILEVGTEGFVNLVIAERKNVEEVKKALKDNLSFVEFEEYRQLYEGWVNLQVEEKWTVESTDVRAIKFLSEIKEHLKLNIDETKALFNDIAKTRAEIVRVFNEIEFKDGRIILSESRQPHSYFGLSHQTHPAEVRINKKGKKEYPKNEALVIETVRDKDGREYMKLFEAQQTSDNTDSFLDFFTPIAWDTEKGKPKMRKNVTYEDIASFVRNGLTDKPTRPDDFFLQPRDITPQAAHNAKLESLIEETTPGIWEEQYFIVHRAVLNGEESDEAKLSLKKKQFAQDIVVLEGAVTVTGEKEGRVKKYKLKGGESGTIQKDATVTFESTEKAKVMIVYAEEKAYENMKPTDVSGEEKKFGSFLAGTPVSGAEGKQPDAQTEAKDTEGTKTFQFPVLLNGEKTEIGGHKNYEYTESAVINMDETEPTGATRIAIASKTPAKIPEIIGEREHTIKVESGRIKLEIETPDGQQIVELYPGAEYALEGSTYRIIKTSVEDAVVDFNYKNKKREKALYAILAMLRNHTDELPLDKKIHLISPSEIFARNVNDDMGSLKWIQGQLRRLVSEKITIRPYQSHLGLKNLPVRDADAISVLIATEGKLREAEDLKDPAVTNFVSNVRVLAIPNEAVDFGEDGLACNMELVGLSLLSTGVKVEDINDASNVTSVAADMQKFLQEMRGEAVSRQDLYYILPYNKLNKMKDIPEDIMAALAEGLVNWLDNLVTKLLVNMPMERFDPHAALKRIREVMLSV
ncbi:hypothetical protein ACFL5Y_01245, partial [Candidatus Omnitrophota bacterium]